MDDPINGRNYTMADVFAGVAEAERIARGREIVARFVRLSVAEKADVLSALVQSFPHFDEEIVVKCCVGGCRHRVTGVTVEPWTIGGRVTVEVAVDDGEYLYYDDDDDDEEEEVG